MELLKDIIKAFSDSEKEQLLQLALARNKPGSKKIQLLRLLFLNPENDDCYFASKIYPANKINAFPQLKKRLKDEIEEISILLKPNSKKTQATQRIKCSELILQSQILLERGLSCEGLNLLKRSLKLAIDEGFHDQILTIFSICHEYKDATVLSAQDLPELEKAIQCHLQILCIQMTSIKPSTIHRSNQSLKLLIERLQNDQKRWAIIDQLKTLIRRNNVEEADELLEKADSENLFSENEKDQRIFCEFAMARIQLLFQKKDFHKADSVCEEYINSLYKNNPKAHPFLRYKFFALFHLRKWKDALEFIQKYIHLAKVTPEPEWGYWKALTLFSLGDHKNALRTNHDSQPQLKDHPDFFLASKMLEIMVLFELRDIDWLEYKMENFRKLLARWKKSTNKRIHFAFLLFSEAYFKSEPEKIFNSSIWKKLIQKDGEYHWSPFGFELLPYDHWILQILDHHPYWNLKTMS